MDRVVSATEARVHFGELLRRITEDGQTVIVERSGAPQVVMISVADYERLCAGAEAARCRDAMEHAIQVGARISARREGRPLQHPVEVIQEGREERDAHYPDLR